MVDAAQPRTEQLRGHAAMLVFSAFVAGSFSFGGRVANDIDPSALAALRMLLAAGIVGGVAIYLGEMRRSVFDASWRYLILGGLYGAYFVLMFEGLKTAPPGSAPRVPAARIPRAPPRPRLTEITAVRRA